LLDFDQIIDAPLVRGVWPSVSARLGGIDQRLLAAELVRTQIGMMVNDVIAETRNRIAASGIKTEDDVRLASANIVGFSPAIGEGEAELKRFMYANLYHHPRQLEIAKSCHAIIANLFAAYHADQSLLPEDWRLTAPESQPALDQHISDFIAGMTDRYAISRHREIVGPVDLPDGF
jgi:dGTPase